MDPKGRFGQARTPNTTFPSSSNPNAIAYWSPLRNLHHVKLEVNNIAGSQDYLEYWQHKYSSNDFEKWRPDFGFVHIGEYKHRQI